MEIVKAWAAPVTLATYEALAPDKNPMFLETRVYQGSSGKVYPLPFIDRIATEPRDRVWQALYIENEFLRVMILPEIGGRIHAGLDKTNGYDFFYRQNVINEPDVNAREPSIARTIKQQSEPAEHEYNIRAIKVGIHMPACRKKEQCAQAHTEECSRAKKHSKKCS